MFVLEPISVSLESLNLGTLLPMLIAVGGALFIIVIDLLKKNLDKTLFVMIAMLVLLLDLCSIFGLGLGEQGFFKMILADGVSILGQILIVVATLMIIPLAISNRGDVFHEYKYPEYFSLFLFMVAGFQFMVSSDNLIMIFVGLETASLALYTLIAMHNTKNAYEAAVKYFTMGAMAAGFFLMGAAAIYATTGSLQLSEVSRIFQTEMLSDGFMLGAIGGAILMLVAVGFKVSLFPFHTWTPDVYEGATAPMAGWMSVAPKLAMMVVALRIFGIYGNLNTEILSYLIIIIAALTMTLANVMALVQNDVKRMLAYSSISHAGFVMAALSLGTTKGDTSIFLYYALFMATNMGAFAMLWTSRLDTSRDKSKHDYPFSRFAGLVSKSPMIAVIIGVFMLSLAGVPPFSLFWGKLYLISSIVDYGAETDQLKYIVLAVILALNSAIAAYYYLKLIVFMFLKPAENEDSNDFLYNKQSMSLQVIVGISVLATVLSIFYIQPLIEFITFLVDQSQYRSLLG